MKYILLLLLTTLPLKSFAELTSVNAGQGISANKINELIAQVNALSLDVEDLKKKVLPVGSVMQSFLTPAQHQAENGDCWQLANGSALANSDELKSLYGFSTIPDATTQGAFLRQAKSGRVLGSFEDDELRSHTHAVSDPAAITFRGGSGGTGFTPAGSYAGPNHSPSISYTGGVETRPKNLAVNLFVKFKKQCNF